MIGIDRLALQIRAAAAPERAEILARLMRDAALAGLQRRRIPNRAPAGGYLFIERLEFSCAINSAWDDDAIGDAVARGLAAALENASRQPGTTAFRDRAEFLAAFLLALAEGAAWSRWWFDEFDGLKVLGASAAIRTAVLDAGDTGVAALARLTASGASQVARTLSAGDASRVLAFFRQRRQVVDAEPMMLWRLSELLPHEDAGNPARWLCAVIESERSSPGTAGPQTLETLRAMAGLRELASKGALDAGAIATGSPLGFLLGALQRWNLAAGWVDRMPEGDLAAVAAALDQLCARAASAAEPDASRRVTAETRYGGALLLLNVMGSLGWLERWEQALAQVLPRAQAAPLARALALRVCAQALAPRAARAVMNDPALLLAMEVSSAFGLSPGARRAAKRALCATGTPPAALLLRALAKRILGLAGSSPAYLRNNALALPATVQRDGMLVSIALGRAPLDVLLKLSGAKRGRVLLPGGIRLELREAAG